MTLDLENTSKDELLSHKKDVEKALKSCDERRMREAREPAEKPLSEYGFSPKDVTGFVAQRLKGIHLVNPAW